MNQLLSSTLTTWWEDRPTSEELLSLMASLRVLVIDFNDQNSEKRISWLTKAGISFSLLEIAPSKLSAYKFDFEGFDVAIVSSCKNGAISQIFKNDSINWLRKSKLFLTVDTKPADRAHILELGFDNIIDISKDVDVEVIARIIAINRRHALTNAQTIEEEGRSYLLRSISYEGELNRRHTLILNALINAPNGVVRSRDLKLILSLNHEPITENQLKVLISQTRKRLRSHATIISLRKTGEFDGAYKLVTDLHI